MNILLCNIGWMLYYQGFKGSDNRIIGGGNHEANNKHEVYNFLPIRGYCYGYVRTTRRSNLPETINLKKLSGIKNFKEEQFDDVLVVWVARNPRQGGRYIVGWYNHATVYAKEKVTETGQRKGYGYIIRAKEEYCVCLPELERAFRVKNGREVRGMLGQSNICYALTSEAQRECKKIEKYIANYEAGNIKRSDTYTDQDNTELVVMEGGKKTVKLNHYERNPKNRKRCIEKYGYKCAVCGFDFYSTYGEIGKNFIHIHHLKPLSDLGGEKEVAVDDLRPVCPNCHAMLHRKKNGVYSISELKRKIRQQA